MAVLVCRHLAFHHPADESVGISSRQEARIEVRKETHEVDRLIQELSKLYTILDPEVEAGFARRLMSLPQAEVSVGRAEVRFILNELYISHVENEITLVDGGEYTRLFAEFAKWLPAFDQEYRLGLDADLLREFAMSAADVGYHPEGT